MNNRIHELLLPGIKLVEKNNYLEVAAIKSTTGIEANAYYFSHPEWAAEYLTYCHRSESFRNRW